MSISYKQSGVDIEAGDAFVDHIKSKVKNKDDIGLFGSVFDISSLGMKNPILVTSTDGVGTKLKIAQKLQKHDTIGIDLVAMCVNDTICHGAKPYMFLDYYATGKLDPEASKQIIHGIIKGCEISDCNLSGGETAEMPGIYKQGEYDLAGFVIGFVEKENLFPRKLFKDGDLLIGLPSSGFHSNGYSLVNRVLEVSGIDISLEKHSNLAQSLLTPTTIYVKQVMDLINNNSINSGLRAFANITGSGIYDNITRVIPKGFDIKIDFSSIKRPEVFNTIQSLGNIDEAEMRRVFNLGVGFCIIVSSELRNDILNLIPDSFIFGEVIKA